MTHPTRAAVAGLVLLLPALVLVTTGVLDLTPPAALVHPVLVMGGVFLAIVLNALPVIRLGIAQDGDRLVGTIAVRVRGSAGNLGALLAGGLLLAIIAVYLFVENFQPRLIG